MSKASELAEKFANETRSIKDIDCPRTVINPGLYFGFVTGYNARDAELEAANKRIAELEDELRSDFRDPEEAPPPMSAIVPGPGVYHYRVFGDKIVVSKLTFEPTDNSVPWIRIVTPGHYYFQGYTDDMVTVHRIMSDAELEEANKRIQEMEAIIKAL